MDNDDFLFPPDMPDELQAKVRAIVDRQHMASTVTRQQISRFFKEVSLDHLETVAQLFHIMTENPHAAIFYEGFAKSLLAERSGVWPGWDEDDVKHDIQVQMTPEGVIGMLTTSPKIHDDGLTPEQRLLKGIFGEEAVDATLAAVDQAAIEVMHEYNVEPSAERPGGVRCLGCGLEYVSMADRMVKAADDCHGCQHKAKFG